MMSVRSCRLMIVLALLPVLPGCALMDVGNEAKRQAWQTFRPKTSDYRDSTEEGLDEWGFVGDEGRGSQDREEDPDRWWQEHVMSAKARHIERNLGID